jgi:ABC-2 type transport system ATP-binding protein
MAPPRNGRWQRFRTAKALKNNPGRPNYEPVQFSGFSFMAFSCNSISGKFSINMAAIISIENLRVEYPSREEPDGFKRALQGISFQVQAGEVFGFLGPNGAGKTTTMNVLLGFVAATSGNAYLFGVNVREPVARQRIGYLPELTYYYKFLTAEELLRFYARIFKIPREEREARIDEVLKLVELEHARKRPLRTYSKGMQQRAGLAQALINDPDLLILDEPTSGLDPIGRMKVREIIQRLKNQGKTVFFSSHELGEVETVCDRVAIMNQGELKVLGRVEELVEEYQCNLEQIFLRIIGFGNLDSGVQSPEERATRGNA